MTLAGRLQGGRRSKVCIHSGKNFNTRTHAQLPIRSVGIELTYNFGKNNFQVKKAQRTITNDDVVNAQNAMQQQSAQTSMQQ